MSNAINGKMKRTLLRSRVLAEAHTYTHEECILPAQFIWLGEHLFHCSSCNSVGYGSVHLHIYLETSAPGTFVIIFWQLLSCRRSNSMRNSFTRTQLIGAQAIADKIVTYHFRGGKFCSLTSVPALSNEMTKKKKQMETTQWMKPEGRASAVTSMQPTRPYIWILKFELNLVRTMYLELRNGGRLFLLISAWFLLWLAGWMEHRLDHTVVFSMFVIVQLGYGSWVNWLKNISSNCLLFSHDAYSSKIDLCLLYWASWVLKVLNWSWGLLQAQGLKRNTWSFISRTFIRKWMGRTT